MDSHELAAHLQRLPAEQVKQAVLALIQQEEQAGFLVQGLPEVLEKTPPQSSRVIDTSVDEELLEILANAKPASDLSEYSGTVALTVEPLDFQDSIRSEW